MRLYLDTEWQNENARELVSLALVSQDGDAFYAERDPLPDAPSSFVREVVYPLLDRGPWALRDGAFTAALHAFLARFEEPLVVADDAWDFTMLAHALGGFGRPGLLSAPPYRPMVVTFGDVLMGIEEYFEVRAEAKAKRHHARVDAEALRWAFESTMRLKTWDMSNGEVGSRFEIAA